MKIFYQDGKKEYQAPKTLTSFLFETKTQAERLEKLFIEAKKQKLDISKLVNFLANKKIKVNIFVDDDKKIINAFNQAILVFRLMKKSLKRQ